MFTFLFNTIKKNLFSFGKKRRKEKVKPRHYINGEDDTRPPAPRHVVGSGAALAA